MTDGRITEHSVHRRNTRANTSLADSDIHSLGLTSISRGKVLRTPPSRPTRHQVHNPTLRDLNPVPRVEISWVSDEEPDDTILEKTVIPSESASAVVLPGDSSQTPLSAQSPSDSSSCRRIEDLVALVPSSAVVGPIHAVADSAVVPTQRTGSPGQTRGQLITQPTTCPSISVADSAPLRSVHFEPPVSVPASFSVVENTSPALGFSQPRDSSIAHPRVENLGPSNQSSIWSSVVDHRFSPSDRGLRPNPCEIPPSMSFLGNSIGDRGESGPSGTGSECPREPRDRIDEMSIEQISEKTVAIVRDLSTMLGGKRNPEVDNLVKSISSEITSVAHKRDYYRTLVGKYHAIIDEFRAHQAEVDQRALDNLRHVANDFLAGVPLSTDGQLTFQSASAGPSSVSVSSRPVCAGNAQQSSAVNFTSSNARQLYTTSVFAARNAPPDRIPQSSLTSGPADPLLAEILTPEFLMECTPRQVAAIEPLYQRITAPQDVSEPDDEEKRRNALALKFPAIFAQTTPRSAARAQIPAVDARKTLNFATPGSTVWNRGSNAGTGVLNAGTGVLTPGNQFPPSGTPRAATQSVEEWLEQKVNALIASKDLKQETSTLQEDNAFGSDPGIAGALRNGVASDCKVPLFKRGNRDMSIENWFFQMRNYFETYSVDSRHWVNICVTRIHTSHFREISPLLCYNYNKFRSECIKLFETPDLTQAYLSELTELAQAKDEDYETYYERVRDLISKAHPTMGVSERESLMVSYFIKGLYDSRVRDVVAATPGISLAEALRRASSVAASRRRSEPSGPPVRKTTYERTRDSETTYNASYARADVGSSRYGGRDPYLQLAEQPRIAGNVYVDLPEVEGACAEGVEGFPSEVDESAEQCDQFAYSQARGNFRGGRGLFRGRGGSGVRKCYNCDQPGHFANGCPYPPKCQICGALHKLEDCPVVKDLIEKRQSGQAAPAQQPRVYPVVQQPAQQSVPSRAPASGLQQQRPPQETRAPGNANRGNALSLIREDDNGGFMPLFATASIHEVKVVGENVEELTQGPSPLE